MYNQVAYRVRGQQGSRCRVDLLEIKKGGALRARRPLACGRPPAVGGLRCVLGAGGRSKTAGTLTYASQSRKVTTGTDLRAAIL